MAATPKLALALATAPRQPHQWADWRRDACGNAGVWAGQLAAGMWEACLGQQHLHAGLSKHADG